MLIYSMMRENKTLKKKKKIMQFSDTCVLLQLLWHVEGDVGDIWDGILVCSVHLLSAKPAGVEGNPGGSKNVLCWSSTPSC